MALSRTPAIGAVIAALACTVGAPAAAETDPARWVNPFIGTGGHGHTYPGPALPFGMIQPGPDTRLTGWDGCSGYHHDDTFVYGFSHTHLSGTGVADYGDILLLPATGDVRWASGSGSASGKGYGSRFRKAAERAEAGYYRVRLDDYGVDAELTATPRTGWHRYTFRASDSAHILVDLRHRDTVLESTLRIVDDTTIEGMRRSKAWAADQPVYFVARFSRPFDALLAVEDTPRPGLREAAGLDVKAALRFRTKEREQVTVKLAISAVDIDGARKNLEAEAPGWDFDSVRAEARRAWNQALGRIEIDGGTADQRTVFYTALYHTLLQPNLFQDVDGRYRGMDHHVHEADGSTRYTVFSLWDTFRAAHPLYTILEPKRTVDFIRTFLGQYREGGRLPVWELWGNETDCMIGYHAVSVIADAWLKGIRGFDPELALTAMRASAEADRFGLSSYQSLGYVAADRESESVSKTLEYAYDDWCIGRFAESLGQNDVKAEYYRRAQAWQHLFDPPGFLRPRANGMWVSPFDPREVTFHYTEANAWQYSFFVPQDLTSFERRLGPPGTLEKRLDALFEAEGGTTGRDQVDITGLVGQYAHGNEPSHHMAYLYSFAGAPHKTQAMVRRLMNEMYSARPDGLAGNEDCGQMSAWFVLSAMGFYPVTPGLPEYVIGSPLFDRVTIHLENGRTFTVQAAGNGPNARYVRGARLNGAPHDVAFLTHAAIVAGGTLQLDMSAKPAAWGSAPAARPRAEVGGDRVTPAPVAEGSGVFRGTTAVRLSAAAPTDVIHYTIDGGEPDASSPRYTEPIPLGKGATIRFRALRPSGWSPTVETVLRRLDPRIQLTLRTPVHPQYRGSGPDALIDGIRGGTDFRLGAWQGFYGDDLDADVDLGESRLLRHLSAGFLHDQNSWIFLPVEVTYSLSEDGVSWKAAGTVRNDFDPRTEGAAVRELSIDIAPARARFVRIHARSVGTCPAWHKGAGNKAFLFADEIVAD